ncbi:MAG: helix-turn-helix domain-containing protein [Mobiluncus sp.]|uniref:helix-turn-helix domain-containing protein n=1 Tax=Mobiluncus sp. TaxID=47293 RepID=UPI00258B51CA|nr:helix-turn-helix transcriptional regulator [Mobiluncus sp.]MCI6584058.1 helix-turn-helix domain-containing protein [Mobiluncus sp.]
MATNRTRYKSLSAGTVLAREIKAELVRKGESVSDLANALGIRRATISNKLNGRTPIATDELFAISDQLGLSPAELIARAEKQYAAADSTPTPNPYEKQVA